MSAIVIKDISKKFRIYHDKSSTLKERVLFSKRTKYEEKQVLQDISLSIEKGTTVGLIGQNGSGKSTLLKLISGIIYPDKGSIEINGRVSSLLELGAGFHPDFSGRENIYNNASIFGLSKKEIDKRYNQIVEFSELEEFIDNPIRTYSSGMYMRLAFAVAINVDADILLIDEVLAVGDANYQKKCMDKLKELKREGKTIVIVSHDTGSIEKLCDTVVWICEGRIKQIGEPRKVIDNYLLYMEEMSEKKFEQESPTVNDDNISLDETDEVVNPNRWGNRCIEITDVRMLNKDNQMKHLFLYGQKLTIEITYKVNRHTDNIVFGIGIFTKDRVQCFGTNTYLDKIRIGKVPDTGVVRFEIPELELVDGSYTLDVAVHSEEGVPYDYQTNRYAFDVFSGTGGVGIYKPKHRWIIGD